MASSSVFAALKPVQPYDPSIQEARDVLTAERKAQTDATEYALKQRKQAEQERQQRSQILASSVDQEDYIKRGRAAGLNMDADEKAIDEHRKRISDAIKQDHENDLSTLDQTTRLFGAVRSQSQYDFARAVAQKLAGDDPQKMAVLASLPPQYDPQTLQQFVSMGLTAKDQAEQQRKMLEDFTGKDVGKGLFNLLSQADSPEEWSTYKSMALELGAPKALVMAAGEFSPESKTRAGQLALSPEKRAELKQQAETAAATRADRETDNARLAAQAAETARHNRAMEARPVAGAATGGGDDPKEIAAGIIDGSQPPTLTGMYRNTAAVRAELHRQGYDLTRATEDWNATQKLLTTLNGAQQTRLRQAVEFTSESLPLVRQLVSEWDSKGYPLLSKAALDAAASGAGTKEQQSLAVRLKGQIADLTSELGTVYKGGNSSTDESLKLAASNLQGDWSKKAALDALDQIDKNLTMRRNSIKNTGPIGGREQNPYAPQGMGGGSVPDNITSALKGQPDGTYKAPDGTRWTVKGGVVTKAGG